MKEDEFITMCRGLATDWAALCAVRVKKAGEASGKYLGYREWVLQAGNHNAFTGLPGIREAEVAFMTDHCILRTDATEQQCRDYFRQQWTMAMISLMDLLTEPNRVYNFKLAEAARKVAGL